LKWADVESSHRLHSFSLFSTPSFLLFPPSPSPTRQIKSIKFTEFNQGLDPESNPSKVHLYVNRENLGFEDCEDVDPTQTLHLTTEDLKESADPIALKYVRYQRVTSLTIFVEDNQGGEVSALGGLKLYGFAVDGTNMSEFKKKPEM